MATITITIASPAVVTHTGHGMPDGNMVAYTTTGTLPTGIVATTAYYAKYIDDNTYNLAATRGGASINTSGSQAGVHTGKELTGIIDEENLSIQDGSQAFNLSNVPLAVNVYLTNIVTGSRVRVGKASDNAELFLGVESAGLVSFVTKFAGNAIVDIRKKGYIPYRQAAVIGPDGLNLYVSQNTDEVAT